MIDRSRPFRGAALLAALGVALASPSLAQPRPPAPGAAATAAKSAPAKERPSALGNLGSASSKEPIKIDADRLDVFDREGRAVFTGNVVAVQGDTTMRCSIMTIFYEQKGQSGGQRQRGSSPDGESSIKKIDCKGPVTIVSKTQVATGDNAEFDRAANVVYLIGNATLSDGPNVTQGERVVYDLNSSTANITGAPTAASPSGRVKALFVPGSQDKTEAKNDAAKRKPAATN